MSNPEQVAFENLQRLATMFRGIVDIAPQLGEIASLKGAAEEARARVNAIRADADNAEEAFRKRQAEAQTAADGLKQDAQVVAAQMRAQAQKHLEDAQARAAAMTAAAERQAADMIKQAAEAADAHEHRGAAAKKEIAALEQTKRKHSEEVGRLYEAVTAKQAEHERVKTLIAETKAKLG